MNKPAMAHIAARSLSDLKIEENLYKADFEVSSRYDALATELFRLALTGIAAYGFFLTKAGMDKEGNASQALNGFVDHPLFPIAGLLAFAIAAGCALYCRYLNSRCLKLQIDILRLLGRIESGRWNDERDMATNQYRLEEDRTLQKSLLSNGRNLIFVSVVAMTVGAGATVISFVVALFLAHSKS